MARNPPPSTPRSSRLALILALALVARAPAQESLASTPPTLKVLTFNAWHGPRTGTDHCEGDHFGFQTKEALFALFGEVTVGDEKILLFVANSS